VKLKKIFKDGKVDYIEAETAPDIQRFTQRFMDMGESEGWLTVHDAILTIKSKPQDIVYKIVKYPGVYCCHCELSVTDGNNAKVHVAENHNGIPSPDDFNKAGYRYDNFYECQRGG
jgi:hypothetical protein